MIFSKRINVIHFFLTVIFLAVCVTGIVNINSKYPDSKIVNNEKSGYIMYKYLELKPVEMKIYTPEAFVEAFPDTFSFRHLVTDKESRENIENYRIIYYKISATNNTDNEIRFNMSAACVAVSFPRGWHNGIPPMAGPSSVKPGETAIFQGAALCTPGLGGYKNFSEMENEKFCLLFLEYPERIIMKFE